MPKHVRLIPYDRLEPDKGIFLTRVRIMQLVADGEFPCPVKFNGRIGWPENEVDQWIRARMAERPAPGNRAARRQRCIANAILAS
jgi:prophage regulatory protein